MTATTLPKVNQWTQHGMKLPSVAKHVLYRCYFPIFVYKHMFAFRQNTSHSVSKFTLHLKSQDC